MMKKIKSLVTVIAVAAALILPAGMCTLKASAAEPASFHIAYDPSNGGWYVHEWKPSAGEDDSPGPRVIQFFYNEVKDGDVVVVSNNDASAPLLNLGSVKLSNLTLMLDSDFTMIQAGGITELYTLNGSSCSITAPVTNAYIYDRNVVQFNDIVQNIIVKSDEEDFTSTIGASGTVGSFNVTLSNNTSYTLYNFKKGSLIMQEGSLLTDAEDYSKAPSAAPAATAAPQLPSAGNPSDEYDKVPKTGDVNPVVWLFCAGAFCMALSCVLRGRKSSR